MSVTILQTACPLLKRVLKRIAHFYGYLIVLQYQIHLTEVRPQVKNKMRQRRLQKLNCVIATQVYVYVSVCVHSVYRENSSFVLGYNLP